MSNTQFAILIFVILVATGSFWRVAGGMLAGTMLLAVIGLPIAGGVWLYNSIQEEGRKHQALLAAEPYCVGFETGDPSGTIDIVRMSPERFASWRAGTDRTGGSEIYGRDCRNVELLGSKGDLAIVRSQ